MPKTYYFMSLLKNFSCLHARCLCVYVLWCKNSQNKENLIITNVKYYNESFMFHIFQYSLDISCRQLKIGTPA